MKAFIIIIIGGIGSLPGCIIGGFIIGFIESFGSYLGSKIDHESWTSTANIIENLMKDRHI